LRVGGPADVYVEPASEEIWRAFWRLHERRTAFFVDEGRGSNLLVRDGGFRGVSDLPGARGFQPHRN